MVERGLMVEKGLVEAMSTLRSIRHFTAEPVPDDLLKRVLELAARAPSGGNFQPWRFMIIRDPGTRRRIGEIYLESFLESFHVKSPEELLARPRVTRGLINALYQAQSLGEVPPVLILVCNYPIGSPDTGSSIFPAVQNLMLAAWNFGLGTVLLTAWLRREKVMRELLGVPPEVKMAALIPIGHPAKRYGPSKRRPVDEVIFYERWESRSSP